ncbi:extracellular solute-binding protein, family 5 Middle [Arthrobacter sp. yr096]|uniref:hypothetical protein n=1 Tax=Arthrobacter sp. yr096 TaxID=1761750 RepID=UPI0008AFCA5F|nr:hypothetical protein [Arthrobacter sp. yr096]SEI93765.1 extracellular solute-binding protein, family 5 Middle [Arthrobacter sp. yr096]
MTLQPDGNVLTLTLKEGVTFTDGSALDAALVKANLDRRRDTALKRLLGHCQGWRALSRVGAGIGIFLIPRARSRHADRRRGRPGRAGLSQWLAPETEGKALTAIAAGYTH